MALANESKHEITSIAPPVFCGPLESSSVERMEGGSSVSSIEDSIEKSKSHWSQVRELDSDNEVAEVSNVELFRALQRHPTWGTFFMTFGEGEGSDGVLRMGKKFAEGGQAELYEVQMKWNDPEMIEFFQKHKYEYVLKVFKKGTSLQHLQSQWPRGMLQHHVDMKHRQKLGLPFPIRFYSVVLCATLLDDGRFVFLMKKEDEDLRRTMDQRMLTRPKGMGPFSKDEVEGIMYEIARGMDQLHGQGIVHRDIKASNVLRTRGQGVYVADFECSVGVVGTGFFRAPEILQACKDGTVHEKVELFTKAMDVYSYGMTCYEIWTGKLPFEGHPSTDYDLVLQGQRPKLSNYVDGWIQRLLNKCWQSNAIARPSSQEILKILLANSATCRRLDLLFQKHEVEAGIRKALARSSKNVEMWRSLKLRLPTQKMLRLCRK